MRFPGGASPTACTGNAKSLAEGGRLAGGAKLAGHSVNLSRLEDALDVLAMLNRPDAAILADVYHTYRGGSSFASYRRLSAALLPILHVNDYPATPPREKLVDADRVWPGDGIAPWKEIFDCLDAVGADPWLSIELFNPAYWRTTPADTLRTGISRVKSLR